MRTRSIIAPLVIALLAAAGVAGLVHAEAPAAPPALTDDLTPNARECAAYYLLIEDQLRLYTAIIGRPPVTLGPASDWAHQQLSPKNLSESPLVGDPFHRPLAELGAAMGNDLSGAMRRPGYIPRLQQVVDRYDGPCQKLSGQKRLDLAILTEDVPPPPPSELECAAYYSSIAAQFALETSAPRQLTDLLGPMVAWIEAKQNAADSTEVQAARASFSEQAGQLASAVAAQNGGLMRVVVRYFDPLCHPVSGLPPLDLDAMFAAARSQN